eukprot:Nk52_evm6s239 gene=Nk52_evmTU6s239
MGFVSPTKEELAFLGLQAAGSTLIYPFTVVRVLIQQGHEPIPPKKAKLFFGQTVYQLPSAWAYAKIIYRTQGFKGLYRGYAGATIESLSYSIVRNVVRNNLHNATGIPLEEDTNSIVTSNYPIQFRNGNGGLISSNGHSTNGHDSGANDSSFDYECEEVAEPLTMYQKVRTYVGKIIIDIVAGCAGIIVSHPFSVVSLRKVAQIAGGEVAYDGFLQPWIHIWKNEGLEGVFAGLAPALIGEVVKIVCLSLLRHGIEHLLPLEEDVDGVDEYEDEDINSDKKLIYQAVQLMATPLVYPFSLVKTRMVVNNCDLVVGKEPYAPVYRTWVSCFTHMYSQGGWTSQGLLKGSGILRRNIPCPNP